MSNIKFGTDGWRAVIAEDFTFRNVERLAQAAADHWKSIPWTDQERKVVVGFDRRFLSDQFAKRTAEVMAGNGLLVELTKEPTPTPAVSYAVKARGAVGGVMITASHNPAAFNGFKLKSHYGGSADQETCQAVEHLLDRNPVRMTEMPKAIKDQPITVKDLGPEHLRAVKRRVDFKLIARSGIRFAHEALYGVGAGCFDRLLAGTSCRVTTLNARHDPLFGGINPEPIERNYGATSDFLRKHPHDLCLVTDGDADRIGGLDGRGKAISTHQLICLVLRHLVVRRQGRGRMVKALTTTSMVDKMCAEYGLELVETGVGFKHLCAEMLKGGVLLGAEESGGLAFPEHIPERDGILAGLMLLELLAAERVPIRRLIGRLEKQFGPHRYARLDMHFPLEKRAELMGFCQNHPPSRLLGSSLKEIKSFDGVKFIGLDGCWLMLRGSGTEPILRIYAEARSDADAQRLLRMGLKLTRRI